MGASLKERKQATSAGVRILTDLLPKRIGTNAGKVKEIVFGYANSKNDNLEMGSEEIILKADQIFKAIGQTCDKINHEINGPAKKIITNKAGRVGSHKIWAGGDCNTLGEDLTVTAVAHGRDAAEDINKFLNHS